MFRSNSSETVSHEKLQMNDSLFYCRFRFEDCWGHFLLRKLFAHQYSVAISISTYDISDDCPPCRPIRTWVDWKWRTWKWRTIKIAGHEIAGHEKDGPNSRAWKCRAWNCRIWFCGTEKRNAASSHRRYIVANALKPAPQAPLYPHRTLWRYTNIVLLLLLL